MASKKYQILLDNEQFKRSLRETQQMVARNKLMMERDLKIGATEGSTKRVADAQRKVTEETKRTGEALRSNSREIDGNVQALGRLGRAMAGIFGAREALRFVQTLAQVRGQFQQTEIAFSTLLKSQEKADKLMRQLTETAAKTPFDFSGITHGAQQLLAYGTKVEEVNDKLLMLGDIAAGLSLPLGDLVYLYGTTMTQGRMYTMDLRQFMGRGIPLAEELAKQFGVATSKVQDLVREGKVGAKEFDQAIQSLRKNSFNNLMEAQSSSITGQISNLQDNIEVMLNEMGKASEGAFGVAINSASWLVEHYKEVGKVLASLVATYGTYKAVMIAVASAQAVATGASQGYTLAQQLQYKWLLLVEGAQKLVNKTMLANPYVLVASAVAGLVGALVLLHRRTNEAEQAQERHNEKLKEQQELLDTNRQKADKAIGTLRSETATRYEQAQALDTLQRLYPAIFANMDAEAIRKEEQIALQKRLNAEDEQALLLAKQKLMTDARNREAEAKRAYETARGMTASGGGSQELLRAERAYRQAMEDRKTAESDFWNAQSGYIRANLTEEQKASQKRASLRLMEKQLADKIAEQERQSQQVGIIVNPMLQIEIDNLRKGISDLRTELEQTDSKPAFASFDDTVRQTTQRITELQERLRALRAGEVQGIKDYQAEIKKVQDELKKEQSAYETLTGKEYGAKATKGTTKKTDAERRAEYEARVREDALRSADAFALQGLEGLERIETQYHQTMATIQRQKEAYMRDYNATQLQANALYQAQEEQALREREQATAEHYTNLLERHATYAQQALKIKEEAEQSRQHLRTYGERTGTDVSGNLGMVDEREQEQMDALALTFAMKQEEFEEWVNKVADMSLDVLQEQLTQAQALLDEMGDDTDPEKMLLKRAKIQKLQERLKGETQKGAKRTNKDWKDLYRTLSDVGQEFRSLGDDIGGAFGQIVTETGTFFQSTLAMIDGITTLATGSMKSVEGTSKSASTAIKAVETASVILAIIGAALRIIQQVVKWTTKTTEITKEQRSEYQSLISTTRALARANRELMESLSGEELKRKYLETIEAIKTGQEASSKYLGEVLASGTKRIMGIKVKGSLRERLEKDLYDYRREFERVLGIQIGTWSHTSWWNVTTKGIHTDWLQNLSLEQMKALKASPTLWAKLGKEVTDVYDHIIEANKLLEETSDDLRERYTQTTTDRLQSDLLGFLDELNEGMKAPAETFERTMKNALKRVVKDRVLTEGMNKFYEQFYQATQDENLTLTEVQTLRQTYMELVGRAKREYDTLTSVLGKSGADDPRTAQESVLSQASQDSVDELIGLWHTSVQVQSRTETSFTAYAQAMQAMQAKGWQDVAQIRNLTEKIEQSTRSLDTSVKDIGTNGIKLKS